MWQLQLINSEWGRALLLLLPVAGWIALFLRGGFIARSHAGALLAFIWQFQASVIISLLLLNVYQPTEVTLGQAVLLGPVNFLLLGRHSAWPPIAASSVLLLLFAPISASFWPWYLSNLGLVCLPSLLLANWTRHSQHLYIRCLLQTLCWACLLLWLFPNTVFQQLNGGWDVLLKRPLWQNAVFLVPMTVPGLLLALSVFQFAFEGRGTGFPYDPPQRLVTNGIYAYISNPMQLGICLLMLFWGFALMNIWISASAFVALFLFVVFKDICNGSCAIGKTDKLWTTYQNEVPKWRLRRKPWSLHTSGG
jgi:protein-S-isoprenylcysteine O-methyltransferase Ste14